MKECKACDGYGYSEAVSTNWSGTQEAEFECKVCEGYGTVEIEDFELSEEQEQALQELHEEFVEGQEEIPASNDCEGGGCIL